MTSVIPSPTESVHLIPSMNNEEDLYQGQNCTVSGYFAVVNCIAINLTFRKSVL